MNIIDQPPVAARDPAPADRHGGLRLYESEFTSRLLLGTAQYPSPEILGRSVAASGTQIVTVSLRRETAQSGTGDRFFEKITGSLTNVMGLPMELMRSLLAGLKVSSEREQRKLRIITY